MKITIREAVPDDMQHGFAETLSALSPVKSSADRLKDLLWMRTSRLTTTIVAVLDDEDETVVGTISYWVELKFIHDGGRVCHVEDVAVRKDLQRQGIGRKLMDYVDKIAARDNCYKIILDCGDHNIGFYEKCGYRKHESMMRKDLG